MSKRDMRAKKLLLAVLLAMSMQSYHAAPRGRPRLVSLQGRLKLWTEKGRAAAPQRLRRKKKLLHLPRVRKQQPPRGKMALIQMLPCRLFPTVCVPPVPATMIMASCRW